MEHYNVEEEVVQKMDDIHDLYYFKKTINKAITEQIINIQDRKWEEHYKPLAGDRYMSLKEVLTELKSTNTWDIYSNYDGIILLVSGNDEEHGPTTASISKMIHYASACSCNLGPKFKEMICKCCVCNNCASVCHCNNYTCTSCKKDGYAGYDWICEE